MQPSHPLSSPSPPALSLSQYQGLFQWVSSSHEVAKVLEFQLQHQSHQWTSRTDLLQNELVGSPCSPRDSQESSPTPQLKSIGSSVLSFLYSPTVTSIHDHWKNHSLSRQTFVGKVMSLLLNMLSRLVVTFNFMAIITICSDFGAQKNKVSHCFHCFYLPWSDGTGCHDLRFWILTFKPYFSHSSFTFIKRLFCFSSFTATRVVLSAYLKLLIFLLAILIPACDSSSLAFWMMYFANRLNKQGENT